MMEDGHKYRKEKLGNLEIVYEPDILTQWAQEITHHDVLIAKLEDAAARMQRFDLDDKIAVCAAHLEIALDGYYTADAKLRLVGIMTKKLRDMRTTIYTTQ